MWHGLKIVCALLLGLLWLKAPASAGVVYDETLPPGATVFNPGQAYQNGIAFNYNLSTTGIFGSLTGLPSNAGAAFYVEVIGPKTVPYGATIEILLSNYIVTHTGNDYDYFSNCYGGPPDCQTSQNNYAYAITSANNVYICSNYDTVSGYNVCEFPSYSALPYTVTTNTPFQVSISSNLVAVGAASEGLSVGFEIYGGPETPYSGITDPQDYQLVYGTTIASLPSYGDLPPTEVPEPASLLLLATGLAATSWAAGHNRWLVKHTCRTHPA